MDKRASNLQLQTQCWNTNGEMQQILDDNLFDPSVYITTVQGINDLTSFGFREKFLDNETAMRLLVFPQETLFLVLVI